jgi:hypothetical protein
LAAIFHLDAKLFLVCADESNNNILFSAGADVYSYLVPSGRGLSSICHFTFAILISTKYSVSGQRCHVGFGEEVLSRSYPAK